jgi:hypothetical protein
VNPDPGGSDNFAKSGRIGIIFRIRFFGHKNLFNFCAYIFAVDVTHASLEKLKKAL